MPEDEKAGASSTPEEINAASDAALAESDFSRYAAVENARDAGKAIPEAPPASSVKTPASEPGTDKSIQEKKPKTGEDRKAELHAEIQELLRQRAELQGKAPAPGENKPGETKPGEKKADPPPAAVTPPPAKPAAEAVKPATGEAPKEPNLDDFATYAEYQKADRKYVRELVQFEAEQVAKKAIAARDTERAAAESNAAAGKIWEAKVAAAKEEHADYAEVAFSKDTPITPAMDGFILDSEHGARILYELGKDGSAEGKRIAALLPFAAVRALIAIEAGLTVPAAKTAPVKRITTAAPAPATDLGSRNADPADPELAALTRGDTATYMRLANAREAKARRAA
jgi:hypothetical protein